MVGVAIAMAVFAALVVGRKIVIDSTDGNVDFFPKTINYIGNVTIQNVTYLPGNYYGTEFTFHFVAECPPDVSEIGLRQHGIYGCGGWETPNMVYPYSSRSNVFLVTGVTPRTVKIECDHEVYHLLSVQTIDQDHAYLERTVGTSEYPDYPVCRTLVQMFQNGTFGGLV